MRDALIRYCQKSNTRVAGPFFFCLIPPIYLGEDLTVINSHSFQWQKELLSILEQDPHPRHIIWIFDPIYKGGNGKSTFAKYLVFHEEAQVLSWDLGRDPFYARKVQKHKRIVFFDFTRSCPKFVKFNDLFSSIEQIKNGMMFAGKYDSSDFTTAIPHVICFSNYLPPAPGAISIDRWLIFRIGNTTKKLIPMDQAQCNQFILDYAHFECQLEDFNKQTNNFSNLLKRSKKYHGLFPITGGTVVRTHYSPNPILLQQYGD